MFCEHSQTSSNIKTIQIKIFQELNIPWRPITLKDCSINITGRTFAHNFERTLPECSLLAGFIHK